MRPFSWRRDAPRLPIALLTSGPARRVAGGERSVDAIWTCEAPYDAVAETKDHFAFYPDRVDAIEELAA